MDICKKLLINLPIKIIIWKKNERDKFACSFSNLQGTTEGDDLSTHINNNPDIYENKYEQLLSDKTPKIIRTDNKSIKLNFVTNDIFVETHFSDNTFGILSSISHKIRNPLTNIVGILSILDDSNLTDEQRNFINIIRDSSFDIVSVVNDIIDILNLEKHKISLDISKVNFKEFSEGCLDIVRKDIEKKKIISMLNFDKNLPDIISADKDRLQQIIISILTNAVDHTEFGNVVLDISLFDNNDNNYPFEYKNCTPPFYNILFKIKDTGEGMSQEKKDEILELLNISQKDENITMQSFRFTGFGLLISKYLCNLMGGNIWFKTEKDMGTIFYFNIICRGIKLY